VAFLEALEAEGILERIEARSKGVIDLSTDDPDRPILLAVSDNGAPMSSG
jgi:hypothetical protein